MPWTADGFEIALPEGGTLLLSPFAAAYGVTFPTIDGAEDQQGYWTYATSAGINVYGEEAEGGVVFHVKQEGVHVGVRWVLNAAGPWYGLGERVIQTWPLEAAGVVATPLQPHDHSATGTLNITTPLLIGGAGVALLVAADTGPLDCIIDDRCVRLTQAAPPVPFGAGLDGAPPDPAFARLHLRIWTGDLRSVTAAAHEALGLPQRHPPLELCAKPIWTTWARYKMHIDQATTLAFAKEIADHGFARSVLEIDDRWQTEYGDMAFDPIKFPDPRAMVEALHGLGFRVTLWVPPFFSPKSAAYAEAARLGYLLRHPATGEPYLTRWWQGWAALIDVSNPAALDWWRAGLQKLQSDYGIDGFKFDGGEANFLPSEAQGHAPLTGAEYADTYVAWVAEHWEWTEVRAGWRSQRCGILFREWDKWSRWGRDNGLYAVVTQALALSVIGYPFVLPDMIGGNAYNNELPDRELLIRWTQVTALLPAMQFSIPPWAYDDETVAICRRYVELHEQLGPYIETLLKAAVASPAPLVRPLWWDYPQDAETLSIDDQWLFGPQLLVAPILQPGQSVRRVYLPEGHWRDYWTHSEIEGPATIEAYPAPLETLPLFERLPVA